MPNRIIKESICTSENIDLLSPFQETVFYRLLVNCDDYGCFDARIKVVSSRLFPLRVIRPSEIAKALDRLSEVGLITLYEVDGKPYLKLKKWADHQRLRASKHKYPIPEDGTVCDKLPQVAASCGELRPESNPIQSNKNPNPNPNPTRARAHENAHFEEFWSVYPRHEDKQAAKKAFDKIDPDDDLFQVMMKAIADWKQSDQWQEDGGKFIPYPSSWLNKRRWEDEVPLKKAVVNAAKIVVAQQYGQRDYSTVQAELEAEQDREMEEFMRRQSHGI